MKPPGAILRLTVTALLIYTAASQSPTTGYTNHTVGGTAGWLFNTTTNTTSANYTAWALTQTFSLGDFLIFNTNSNESVVQTYNETTYRSCSTADASDADTSIYDNGDLSFGEPLTITIPLTIEGPNYYFSDTDDGIPCLNGMAFEIHVNHGLGLPPSLNQPPPPPYTDPPNSPPSVNITIPAGDSQTPSRAPVREDSLCAMAFAILVIFFSFITDLI